MAVVSAEVDSTSGGLVVLQTLVSYPLFIPPLFAAVSYSGGVQQLSLLERGRKKSCKTCARANSSTREEGTWKSLGSSSGLCLSRAHRLERKGRGREVRLTGTLVSAPAQQEVNTGSVVMSWPIVPT
jgi:hypothetical protein